MSELDLRTNNLKSALAFAEGAKGIREEIVQLSPGNRGTLNRLAASESLIGDICQKLEKTAVECGADPPWQSIVDPAENRAAALPEAEDQSTACWSQLVASLNGPVQNPK
jgi:hypothetical protein